MKLTARILLFASLLLEVSAEDLSVPTKIYANKLLLSEGIRNYWTGSTDGTSARDDPNGGYLFRFEFHFETSNDVFAFLATNQLGSRHDIVSWTIYQKMPAGQWKEITNTIFQLGGISVHHPSRTIIQEFAPYRHDPEERRTYVLMEIKEDGSVHKESFQSDQLNEKTREFIDNQATSIAPKIEKIPLAAYLRSPQTKWLPMSEHSMAAQSLDPADAPLLASIKDLDWSQAVDLAKSLIDNPLESEPQRPDASSESMPQAPKPIQSPQTESTSLDEPRSSTRWPVAVAMIVLALGLLRVLFKKRK